MKFSRSVKPSRQLPITVKRYNTLVIDTHAKKAWLDGKKQPLNLGRWMFYLPREQLKCFHATEGMTDCIHALRPSELQLLNTEAKVGRYTMGEWSLALQTPINRRLAEIWVVSARLWQAGLGPQPLGVVRVDQVTRDGENVGASCGILKQNVAKLPRKLDCRIEHIRDAGVQPDKILSCVRQQRRGYVIDLCSVVGCQPSNAENEVTELLTALNGREKR
ncbi:Uncharacterised protein [Zhongshania aliphaticivorans]|uniref:Uncharacterized protein n=1 Tax=Zhongshania aliphaticivorans TaxID=1470434 RepID=A0A5S9Q9D1_9GAMM|nr:hypothetical protein [Zhongshania aliphaticivorans]CAA0102443.1 Uncharacterised protein [Zhongshania aliphaticivorans]CAA0114246.1 Uncharacterised protein [Zhongshania aliphaticivorans]